ncbi:MAG: DUF222 domain-containing protein, partial [Propionibacteriaceae bacterium]|nr:DUF222 domain-containing protein [Propionibacteriaceae bacterium]
LPQTEAEAWMAILDAHAESQRRAVLEARDPLAPPLSPEQRRADALVAMVTAHQVARQAPASGGDRPRVLVFLDYRQLQRDAAAAGLITDDTPLSAGELRRLCCDAGVLPVVLGGGSEPLDVGREHRLVTPAIRAALTTRDRGCAFPTCNTRPAVCEAHHIVPWWADGATALSNMVLLCHHHHSLVEPAKHAIRDQWQVRIAADGLPEFIPPRRMDADRRPIRHRRHCAPDGAGATPGDGAPSRHGTHQRRRAPEGGASPLHSTPTSDHGTKANACYLAGDGLAVTGVVAPVPDHRSVTPAGVHRRPGISAQWARSQAGQPDSRRTAAELAHPARPRRSSAMRRPHPPSERKREEAGSPARLRKTAAPSEATPMGEEPHPARSPRWVRMGGFVGRP